MVTPMSQGVNTDQIMGLFHEFFACSGKVTVDPATGLISTSSRVILKRKAPRFPVGFDTVNGDFICNNKGLESLVGAPRVVQGDFQAGGNLITSLAGSPRHVTGDFDVYDNKITSAKGAPETVKGTFLMIVHKETPLLDLLHTAGGVEFMLWEPRPGIAQIPALEAIMDQYAGSGYDGVVPCAAKLAKAGYSANARMG